ncbi:hypothetical protein MCOR22_011631 [Pyricularia oryzae]|nr:hypothetical protein MCOR22_011631 [Pyricularia oryzae]
MVVSGGDGRGQTFHRCLSACRVAAARSENLADDIGPRGASDGPVLGAGLAGPEFKAWTARLAYGRHRGDHAKGDDKSTLWRCTRDLDFGTLEPVAPSATKRYGRGYAKCGVKRSNGQSSADFDPIPGKNG